MTPSAPMRFSESAADFFAELAEALACGDDTERAYHMLNHAFVRALDVLTEKGGLVWGGTYARADYVLSERQAPADLVRRVNEVRVRLRRREELGAAALRPHLGADFTVLCRFIALAFDTEVPRALRDRFTAPAPPRPAAAPGMGRCVRAVVSSCNDHCIMVRTEAATDGAELPLLYDTDGAPSPADARCLKEMLRRGTQLNLICPTLTDGVIRARHIIYEPDYLVDISAVAACFTAYADSPLVHLLGKFRPRQTTSAILLGQFASQLLDEAIHTDGGARPYKDSVNDFFHQYALPILTAGLGADFHDEARRQAQHIRRALTQTLPRTLSTFDRREGMVEPSFFSEMLGLQGRMDYLQLDMSLLMEQKSGKGAYPYDGFRTPRRQTAHYVQMLLYMLLIRYNYHTRYEANQRRLSAFLLYSKYEESLLGLSFAPGLIHRALRIRNGIVHGEMQAARPGGIELLARLSPDALNEKGLTGRLWTDYVRPQLTEVTGPVQAASETERAYFFRFVRFVENEQLQAKLGSRSKENSGFAAKWYDSLEEKRRAGNIYDALRLLSPLEGHRGTVSEAVLAFEENDEHNMSNFRPGDVVLLYAYDRGQEPDVRRRMVFRCHIRAIGGGRITLSLRAPQGDARAFVRQNAGGRLWAIEHDFVESSFAPLYRGLHAFLTAPEERRRLLLLEREPEVDERLTLRGSYGAFDPLMLRVRQARDLFLIIGPPGTGKTSFGMLNTLREELLSPEANVLILSYTNRAVDEICSKLVATGIPFLRLGSLSGCAPAYRPNLWQERVKDCGRVEDAARLLDGARVVVGTATALNSHIELLARREFSLAIIDEASQILEPHLVGLLSAQCAGRCSIRRFVLIGDHKQLPAVVQQRPEESAVDHPLLRRAGLTDCRLSLFERLLGRYGSDPRLTYMLSRQGRMHRLIAHFPNIAFYGGRLQEVPLPHQTAPLPPADEGADPLTRLIQTQRVAFIDVPAPEGRGSDKVNQAEADLVAQMARRIYGHEPRFDPDRTLGVIVPYRNQIVTIRSRIEQLGIAPLARITIDTVERFQGSQRKHIIYGFTVRRAVQLNFLTDHTFADTDGTLVDRKLNVAMTRAEEHLYLLGHAPLLARAPVFRRLLDYMRGHGHFFRLSDLNASERT